MTTFPGSVMHARDHAYLRAHQWANVHLLLQGLGTAQVDDRTGFTALTDTTITSDDQDRTITVTVQHPHDPHSVVEVTFTYVDHADWQHLDTTPGAEDAPPLSEGSVLLKVDVERDVTALVHPVLSILRSHPRP